MSAGRIPVAAMAVLLAACATSQPQADEALKVAESAITAQHADAMRFAPEVFAAVMASYDSARAAYDREDWSTVVAAAERTAARARELAPAITAGKAAAAAHWPMARDSVRAMVTALGERLAGAQRTGQLPDGMTAADVRAARGQLDSLMLGLTKAQAAFDKGDLAGAIHATERIRAEAGALMGAAGLRPRNPHGM